MRFGGFWWLVGVHRYISTLLWAIRDSVGMVVHYVSDGLITEVFLRRRYMDRRVVNATITDVSPPLLDWMPSYSSVLMVVGC